MSVPTVPELRRPPHDPLTLLLGGRLGWPTVGEVTVTAEGALQLPRFPGSLRWLTEPSGSFGGLRLPANVALGTEGELWLLDPTRPRLLRFDTCGCGFVEVPCFAGQGSQPGQLERPGGIAVAAGHLFVCDAGNQRVQVVLTPAMVVSAIWRPPVSTVATWEPTGVVVDERFRVHVVDPQNGMVHHFGWSGRYLGNTPGVGASRHLALARNGTLFVAGPLEAYQLGPNGSVVSVTMPADELSVEFDPAPFAVALDGSLHLSPLCEPPTDSWFSAYGAMVAAPPAPTQLFAQSATAILGPLDSLIDECAWDRVTLLGEVPSGCGLTVETFTAQVALSPAEIDGLPTQAWETRLSCTALENGSWDGLVRSPGGRYLWIRLGLLGNGKSSPRIDEAVIDFPRITLRRYLPSVYGAEPTSADFTDRLLAIFDRSLRDVEARLDDLPALLDPQSTPALDWLASWIGITPDHRLAEAFQRDIVADAGCLLDLRGTVNGLWRLLVLALGMDRSGECGCGGCECCLCPAPRQTCPPTPLERWSWEPPPLILEHFRLRRWFEAGAGRLGDCTMLWGQSIVNRSQLGENAQVGVTALRGTQDPARDPFFVYAHKFTVFVPVSAGATPQRRRALEHLVGWASPAHTQGQVEYVAPRLRIGIQSTIGLDAVVARMPAGVTLGKTTLGPASVLDSNDRQPLNRSAVGTTAVLG
ncbi:MAG: phage tail protein [Marmoricola sp.]